MKFVSVLHSDKGTKGTKWAVVVCDYKGTFFDDERRDFDDEQDALNYVAELVATKGYNFVRQFVAPRKT